MTSLNWQRSIEQIVITNKRSRILGLTAVRRGAGVSLISRHVAKTMAMGRTKTLLVDMSNPRVEGLYVRNDRLPVPTALRRCTVPSDQGYDLLPGTDAEEYRAFSNLPWLRESLDNDFLEYDRVVLDLPPIYETLEGGFNTVASAAICDRLLLVCNIGSDKRSEVAEVATMLRTAGIPLSGVISNEHKYSDPWTSLVPQRWASVAR